jgi:copper(I)-binding protein
MNRRLLWLLGALSIATPALSHEFNFGPLHIGHPYARSTPAAAKTGAAYLRVTNKSNAEDRLLRASTPAAAAVELHGMRMDGNIMRMRPVEAIDIPPGGAVKLEPGGLHLMLHELRQPLKKGDRFPLTLSFEKAGDVKVEIVVEDAAPAAAKGAAHNH